MNGPLLGELMDGLPRWLHCVPSCLHFKREFKQEEDLAAQHQRWPAHTSVHVFTFQLAHTHDLIEVDLRRLAAQLRAHRLCADEHLTCLMSLQQAQAMNEAFFSPQFGLYMLHLLVAILHVERSTAAD